MRHILLATCALGLILPTMPAFAAETLPLKRVTLSTSGLAQFEHQGKVTGDQSLDLPVRLDQVDDVLKSLVVLDDGGQFGGVTLPGREPLSQIFRDLPFDQGSLQTSEGLLQALQGAEVQVTGPNAVTGKLVSVNAETATSKDGTTTTRHRVGIMAKDGLHTAVLEDLQTLQFTDPTVQAQLDRALAAIHDHRIQDQRMLTLDLRGSGERPVTVSYVTGAPLWKSAYRLVLPEEDGGKAYLQGWAILENTTGQDWDNVSMTLLSGNPVTYKQSLYESYFRDRPYLPLRVMDQLMPRIDTGSLTADKGVVMDDMQRLEMDGGGMPTEKKADMRMKSMNAPASPAMMGSVVAAESASYIAADMGAPPMPGTLASAQTAIAEQSTAQMVFNFPQTVTLPAGSSMMLPVISRDVPAEQLWLYQPETNAQHPLTAIDMKNDSDSGLPPGILTLFEKSATGLRYTGDSELAMMPKGESRYLTFALDPATRIDREVSSVRQYGTIKASKGVVQQSVVSRETTTYTIKAPDDEARTIVIEHPRMNDWELKVPEGLTGDPEKTETHYRLKVSLKAGETRKIPVTLEHSEFEGLSLGYMQPGEITARIAAMGAELDPKTRKALEGVIPFQNEVFSLNAQIQKLEEDRQKIFNDQSRVRGNLQSIPSGSDLAKRYLDELNAQEDSLKRIDAEQGVLRDKLATAQSRLNDYVAGLEL